MNETNLTNFLEEDATPPPKSGALVAIFIGGVAVLLYSLYHGISAAWGFSGASVLARLAQSAGMVILEYTLFCILLAWYRGEIVQREQKVISITLFVIGVALSGLNILVDSWNHAGFELTKFLTVYMQVGLPLMPLFVLAGGAVTVETSPLQLNKRREATQRADFYAKRVAAEIKQAEAEAGAELMVRNVIVNAKMVAARHVEEYYRSAEFQAALLARARQAGGAMFAQLGVPLGDEPAPLPAPQRPAPQPAGLGLMAAAPLDGAMPTLTPATPPTDAAGSFQ